MDNLEAQTYEVFEKDPIKYSQYQQVSSKLLHSVTVLSSPASLSCHCSVSAQTICPHSLGILLFFLCVGSL